MLGSHWTQLTYTFYELLQIDKNCPNRLKYIHNVRSCIILPTSCSSMVNLTFALVNAFWHIRNRWLLKTLWQKEKNCSLGAMSSFATMFSTLFNNYTYVYSGFSAGDFKVASASDLLYFWTYLSERSKHPRSSWGDSLKLKTTVKGSEFWSESSTNLQRPGFCQNDATEASQILFVSGKVDYYVPFSTKQNQQQTILEKHRTKQYEKSL